MFEIWECDNPGNRSRTLAYANTWDDAMGYAHIWVTEHGVKNIIVYDGETDNEYRVVMNGWPCTHGPPGNVKPVTNWFARYETQ